jgi:predicted porin
MNKKLISLTLSTLGLYAGLTPSVQAQSSVTLYGLLDAGLRYSTNAGIDLAKNSHQGRLSANSGGKEGSRFGLIGSEDLGGGRKAIFNLEGGFNTGTGALNSKNDNKTFSNNSAEASLFGRQAYVGLEDSKYGKITLGRQFTVGFDTARIFDPSNAINQNGLIYDLSGSADGINTNRRSDSTIKYTFSKEGLTLRGSFKPGNHAGSFTNGNAYALGASYKFGATEIASSFTRISHHRHKEDFSKQITSHGYSNLFNIGLAHKLGKTTLKGGYSNSQIPEINTAAIQQNTSSYKIPLKINAHQIHHLGFGFDHQITPRLNLNVATYGQYKGNTKHGDLMGFKYLVGSTYKLSPRTNFYGYVDHYLNTNNLSAHNSRKSRTGLMLGVSHRF